MTMSAEEQALFGGFDDVPVEPPATTTPADPVAPPPNPKRAAIMPACSACGVDLNPENASQLRDGGWKHIGCAAAKPAPVASDATALSELSMILEQPAQTAPKKRGRPSKPKIEPEVSSFGPSGPPVTAGVATEIKRSDFTHEPTPVPEFPRVAWERGYYRIVESKTNALTFERREHDAMNQPAWVRIDEFPEHVRAIITGLVDTLQKATP